MNSLMDERRDPLRATEAAAGLLAKNYELLGSWPLAITAYNHGTGGMLRAQAKHGSDFPTILKEYDGKLFGFASQNFYAEFLAAVDIAGNYHEYFPQAQMAEPLQFERMIVRRDSGANQLAALSALSSEILRAYNPGLFGDPRRNFPRLPVGYALRIPSGEAHQVLAVLSPAEQEWNAGPATAPSSGKRKNAPRQYRVQKGDTLTRIAALFGVTLSALKQKNEALRSGQVFAGQVILLP